MLNLKISNMLSLLTFLFLLICCKEDDEDFNCNEKLKDKNLVHIKHCVAGTWKIHYRFGGITGQIKQSLQGSILEIKSNDSIVYYDQGQLAAKTKIKWTLANDIMNEKTYLITFQDIYGYPYEWIVDGIYSETLTFYENINDGFMYRSTKN